MNKHVQRWTALGNAAVDAAHRYNELCMFESCDKMIRIAEYCIKRGDLALKKHTMLSRKKERISMITGAIVTALCFAVAIYCAYHRK